MGKEIKQPLKSEMCLAILNRVLTMEEPYPSAIADSLDQQFGNIQSYIDTMVEREWIEKQRKGRKKILTINTWKIWMDTNHTNYLKLYSSDQVKNLSNQSQEELKTKIKQLESESIDPELKDFLNSALEFKIKNIMDNSQEVKQMGLNQN